MPVKLKKGSAAAKAFMAKLRAAKGKPKLKVPAKLKKGSLGAISRKTEDVWIVYGYYPTGKEEVYTAKTSTEAKQIAKNYKENEPYRFTIAPKRIKKGLGTIKKKSPVKSYHKDTKSHNVNVRVVSGLDKVTHKGRKTNVHYSRVNGLDKVTHKGKKTNVHYSRMSGIAKMPTFSDPDAAREIELFAENDGDLYRQQRRPILINLSKKYQKGTYYNLKAAKLWRYFIDTAMKKYQKEFGGRGAWHKLLSTSDRQILAEKWAEETRQEFESGNLY